MAQDFNFGLAVLQRAAEMPLAVALRTFDQEMTYDQLRTRIIRYALQMRLRGVDQRSCVVLDANRMPEGLALSLAISLLGARWIRLSPDVLYDALGVTHVLSLPKPSVLPHPNFFIVDETWTEHPGAVHASGPLDFSGYLTSSDIAYFSQSSGTTGRPKFIAKSYSQTCTRIQQNYFRPFSTVATGFTPLSAIGFHANVGALLRGASIAVDVRNILQAAALGVESMKASPAQIVGMCGAAGSLVTKIPELYAAGSMITPGLLQEWLTYFDRVDIGYGSQETGVVGRSSVTGATIDDVVSYELDDGVRVEIVDESGSVRPPGAKGVVRVRTPSMATRYIGAPEATAEAFRDGWFYPGDVGSLSKDGRLQIHGRVKDQYNLGGVKANAADVDEAASRAPGVHGAVSFTRRGETGIDELGVLAVLAEGASPEQTAGEIRRHCAVLRGKDLVPKSIHFIDHLPLNESGKPMRELSKQMSQDLPAY